MPLPWLAAVWALTLASPFNTTFREIQEMRYLWKQSVTLDNTRLRDTLGREPHTALDEAVETTLRGLGCLGDSRQETLART
jgi:nucleoside-diphosphate-sugar epimerase